LFGEQVKNSKILFDNSIKCANNISIMKNTQKMPKRIALCSRCADGLWAEDIISSVKHCVFKGCKSDSRINSLNRNKLCPILKKVENKI